MTLRLSGTAAKARVFHFPSVAAADQAGAAIRPGDLVLIDRKACS